MLNRWQAALLLCCAPWASNSPAQVAETQATRVCRSPVAQREIRIVDSGATGCRVDYVKDGATRTLWSAATDRHYCASRAEALAATLQRNHFRCEPAAATATLAPRSGVAAGEARPVPATIAALTASQIGAANQWLQQRVAALSKGQAVHTGPEARRYSVTPDFLTAADLDGDGRTDLVLGWGWASFRCDGTYLTVLINDASDAKPVYRPAEVQLPGDCGAKGWLSAVKDVQARRLLIELQQRYPGADNVQRISATLRHDGRFTFFDPAGKPGSLAAIEHSLPMTSP